MQQGFLCLQKKSQTNGSIEMLQTGQREPSKKLSLWHEGKKGGLIRRADTIVLRSISERLAPTPIE